MRIKKDRTSVNFTIKNIINCIPRNIESDKGWEYSYCLRRVQITNVIACIVDNNAKATVITVTVKGMYHNYSGNTNYTQRNNRHNMCLPMCVLLQICYVSFSVRFFFLPPPIFFIGKCRLYMGIEALNG